MIPDTELGLTREEIAFLRHHEKKAATLLVKLQQKQRWFRRDNSISDENVFDDESEEDAVFEAEPDADKAAEKRSRPRTRDGPRGEGFRDRKFSPAAWGEGKKAYSAEQENRELREQEREMERLEDERERQRAEAKAKTQGGEYSNNSDIGQNDSAQKKCFSWRSLSWTCWFWADVSGFQTNGQPTMEVVKNANIDPLYYIKR